MKGKTDMKKKILLSGLLGALVIMVWITISSEIILLSGDKTEEIQDDKEIHSILKNRLQKSGIYWLPGHEGQNQGQYADYENEPIFFVYYAGTTPGTMIAPTIVEFVSIFLTPMIAAWLLSMASMKILARYSRRVLFVAVIGLLFAVYGDLFSHKPLDRMLLSSINHVIAWTLVGLVLAWRIKPEKAKA